VADTCRDEVLGAEVGEEESGPVFTAFVLHAHARTRAWPMRAQVPTRRGERREHFYLPEGVYDFDNFLCLETRGKLNFQSGNAARDFWGCGKAEKASWRLLWVYMASLCLWSRVGLMV
jgi:hypothetical protein